MTKADRLISRTIPESTSQTSIEGSALWVVLGITLGLVAACAMIWLLCLGLQ